MSNSKLMIATLAAALSVGGLTAFTTNAAERPQAQRAGRMQFVEQAKEKLGLTDEQVEKIKGVLDGDRETLKDLIVKLHQARAGLREALQSSSASEASVRTAASKVGAVQTDLAVERFKLFKSINPILTEEQREKVKQFQAQIDEFLDNAINRLGERLSAAQ